MSGNPLRLDAQSKHCCCTCTVQSFVAFGSMPLRCSHVDFSCCNVFVLKAADWNCSSMLCLAMSQLWHPFCILHPPLTGNETWGTHLWPCLCDNPCWLKGDDWCPPSAMLHAQSPNKKKKWSICTERYQRCVLVWACWCVNVFIGPLHVFALSRFASALVACQIMLAVLPTVKRLLFCFIIG